LFISAGGCLQSYTQKLIRKYNPENFTGLQVANILLKSVKMPPVMIFFSHWCNPSCACISYKKAGPVLAGIR